MKSKKDKYGVIVEDNTYKPYDASPCDKCKFDNNRGIICDYCMKNNKKNEYYK